MKRLISVMLCLSLLFALSACKSNDYDEALHLYSVDDYEAASNIFKSLDDYKDSKEKYQESSYFAAYEYIEKGMYDKASELLEDIVGYYNSEDLLKYCNFQISYVAIQSQFEEGLYEEAYEGIMNLSPCSETANILEKIIQYNTLDMVALRNDYSQNSVRAGQMYRNKFYFIPGTVTGFDTSFIEGKRYMILDIDDCSDDVHCYDMNESEILSVDRGDEIIVAGNYDYDYGWIGIDFASCSIVDTDYLSASESFIALLDTSNALCESDVESGAVPNVNATTPSLETTSPVPSPTFTPEPTSKPTPTPKPTPDPMEEAAGTYEMTDAEFSDEDAALGYFIMDLISEKATMTLYADGTGEMEMMGINTSVTWDENTIDTGDGNPGTWRYENGTLYINADGEQTVFEKIDLTNEAEVENDYDTTEEQSSNPESFDDNWILNVSTTTYITDSEYNEIGLRFEPGESETVTVYMLPVDMFSVQMNEYEIQEDGSVLYYGYGGEYDEELYYYPDQDTVSVDFPDGGGYEFKIEYTPEYKKSIGSEQQNPPTGNEDPISDTVSPTAAPIDWYKEYSDISGIYCDMEIGMFTIEYAHKIISLSDCGYQWAYTFDCENMVEEDGEYVYVSNENSSNSMLDEAIMRFDPTDESITLITSNGLLSTSPDGSYIPLTKHGSQYEYPDNYDEDWYKTPTLFLGHGGEIKVSMSNDGSILVDGDYQCSLDGNWCEAANGGGVYYTDDDGHEMYYYPEDGLLIFIENGWSRILFESNE